MALFVALGGSAYAAGVLPANSVGRAQLQANSVTPSKLAPNSVGRSELRPDSVTAGDLSFASVGLRALEPAIRAELAQEPAPGATGAQGPAGPEGPTGAQGPSGPGAVRVHYLAKASSSPTPQTAIDTDGFHLDAECQDSSPVTQLNLSVMTTKAATILENISIDNGPLPVSFAAASSANLQIELPAGTTVLGGPSTSTGEYARIFAHLLYVAPTTTVELTLALSLDGTAGTCGIDGVAVPATS
jgi:hypothetical protein